MLKNPLNIIAQDGIALYHEKVLTDEQIKPLYDKLLNNITGKMKEWSCLGKKLLQNEKLHFIVIL